MSFEKQIIPVKIDTNTERNKIKLIPFSYELNKEHIVTIFDIPKKMNINYHELTMEESKDSPARKKQFVTICVLGIGALSNAMINAGVFQPIQFEEGVFPGGEFHYRMKTG